MAINGLQATTSNAGVTGAIRDAARATGASFDYLLATARAESGLNPNAGAKTSSARGLFQFVDRTWLATLKQSGPGLGYGRYADAITQDAHGRYQIADPTMRAQIFALRDDPAANAAMAGAFTRDNAHRLSQSLGRPPTDGELYMAHFLGAHGASRLIGLAGNSPGTTAASAFPKAAAANRALFYDRLGNARTADQVYAELSNRFDVARTGNATAVAAIPPMPVMSASITPAQPATASAPVAATLSAAPPTSLFRGMFQDEPRRAPVGDLVRELWSSRPHVAAALTGGTAPGAGATGPNAVTAASTTEGLRDLYRDQLPNVRALFTTRS